MSLNACVSISISHSFYFVIHDAIVKFNFLFINGIQSIELNGIFVAPHDIENQMKRNGKKIIVIRL